MSDGPHRFGRRHPGGAQGGEQPGDGANDQCGADAAGPGGCGDDDGPVFGAGVDGGGQRACGNADRATGQGEQDRLAGEAPGKGARPFTSQALAVAAAAPGVTGATPVETSSLAQGSAQQAARLLAAAEALRVTIGTVIAPCDSAQHAATMTGARAALGGEAFAAAWQQGLRAQIDDLQADLAPPGTAALYRRLAGRPWTPAPGVSPGAIPRSTLNRLRR
jgi:hypothetical protein